MRHYILTSMFLALTFGITSCEKDEPSGPNEEELITTVNFILTPQGAGGTAIPLTFRDLDGSGGQAPQASTGNLDANTTYDIELQVLDESQNPLISITEEVIAEGVDHQFFYQSNIAGMVFTYTDQDDNGNPIGAKATLATGNAGSGSITIILRHEPNKTASGVSAGDISNAGGETDVEVTYTINVE